MIKEILVKAIRWTGGIFLCIAALGALISQDYLPGLILCVLSWLIMPLRKKSPQKSPSLSTSSSLSKNTIPTLIERSIPSASLPPRKDHLTDESIIDVTGKPYSLTINANNPVLKKCGSGVPYWKHHYVYSHSEIHSASQEQQTFYEVFRSRFLNGECLDLEGNSNYAFILLFDLLKEYERFKDLPTLEKRINLLGQAYPKTAIYGRNFLVQIMKKLGDYQGIKRVEGGIGNSYPEPQNTYDQWGLGHKYKARLNLKEQEVKLLNKLWYPSNNFCSIEFCLLEVLKLYLAALNELNEAYQKEGASLDQELQRLTDIVAQKHFKYRLGSNNYRYNFESITTELYATIFKYCENGVREHYGHKRKVNTDLPYATLAVKQAIEEGIIEKVNALLPPLLVKVSAPDRATQMELNAQNTSRWKIKFEELTTNFKDAKQFLQDILDLAELNRQNPSIEHIFFDASKFISKMDKQVALTLYVYYIYYDLQSASFDHKPLTKTIQKSLFHTPAQLEDFEMLVENLIKDRNVDQAIKAVEQFYVPKRKKIQLDTTLINEVQQKHSGTVELLNEYLQEEEDTTLSPLPSANKRVEEVNVALASKLEETFASPFAPALGLNEGQVGLLLLFSKSNFTLSQGEVEAYAKSKGLFKNGLIERINEQCYETLDDILIEEEEENYVINENYYQQLIA